MTIRFLMACAILAGLTTSAAAQDDDAGWNSNCGETSCTLSLGLRDTATDRNIATLLTVVRADDAPAFFGVAVPLGTALSPGVRFVAGEEAIEVPFDVCFPDGCRALRELSDDELEVLTATESADLRFFAFQSETPISVKVPLTGLADAMSDARAELAN
jgi:invasion protein IalB